MWRPLIGLALLSLLPVCGAFGATAEELVPRFEALPQPALKQGNLDATAYVPTWRVVLHRLFRKGLGRLLRWGARKLRRVRQGDGFISAALYFATSLIAGLLGPCGRLWRLFVG